MFIKTFGQSFGLTFVAEFGDKTQFAILALAARFGFVPVFLGATGAFLILNAIAVSAGFILHGILPQDVTKYLAGSLFIIFGLLSFLPEKGEEEKPKARKPLVQTFLVIALMEIGDKTQIGLFALSAKQANPIAIFAGGTVALFTTTAIAAVLGESLKRVVPSKWMRRISGVVFISFGMLLISGII